MKRDFRVAQTFLSAGLRDILVPCCGYWGLESPQNPQAGKPALREPIAKLRSGVSAERRQPPVSKQRLRRSAETPLRRKGFERSSCGVDIPVRGFGRLSSRPALPAQTFRPGTVSRACCPNCRAGFRACRLRSFPTSRTKADSLTRNPGTGKSPEPADRNVCPTSEAEIDLGKTPSRCTRQKSPL